MLLVVQIVAAIAALLHIVFFLFESVLWRRPAVYARFDIGSQEEADTIRPMAFNQGFYNLALAIGVVIGIVLIEGHGASFVAGRTLIIFSTGCMALAGVILFSTGRAYRGSAALQFVPAVVTLILASLVLA